VTSYTKYGFHPQQPMDGETALAWVDNLILTKTGEGLNSLQKQILQQVWQGRKYPEIAAYCGYTEGHVKDVGSHLWRVLSQTLGEKINKINCRAVLERCLHTSKDRGNLSILAPLVKGDWGDLHAKPNFVGRTEAIAHLDRLVSLDSKAIVIQGEGGLGKTTLAQQYLQSQNFEVVLELLVAKETQNLTSAERVVEEWLKQDLQEEPGLEFGVTLDRLKRHLQMRRIGVLIDNLEPALDRQGRLIASHRSYVELFRILTDPKVQSVTLITSRDRLCEPSLNVEHYRLPGLDLPAWQQYFSYRQIAIDLPTIQQMHQAYGGNAKVMGILCGTIQADFAGDAIAYWQENHTDPLAVTDLKNLIASQFHRLQTLDLPAYRLLCRLGCYRYQDVAKIPTQGILNLLWDVPPQQQRQIMTALRDRCLVEFQQGEYWLHPAIRAEAIARLRASDEWIVVNCKAAEFWTDSVATIDTIKDALQALEAYYHYVEINDFELAARVILKSRNNQWGQFLPLGGTLYRMGLIQPVLGAITQILQNIQSTPCLGELYNILGDLYWTAGKIHAAIECQEKTISLATQSLGILEFSQGDRYKLYYLKMLEVDSLLSMGLYNIDLWELETAAELFQQVIDLAQNTTHHRWAEKASVCLALVNSYLGEHQTAYNLVEPIYDSIMSELNNQSGSFAYFVQILGQTYINLGNREKAQEMFSLSLADAEKSHYLQIKAKTLSGLAESDRQQSLFKLAINKHIEAIEILEQIGAKCDLAEAYFQLGLTYISMKDFEHGKQNLERSLQLFTQMNAPRQVKKVLQAKIGA
jgi:tetratricopeptide (TPR) repeat protein